MEGILKTLDGRTDQILRTWSDADWRNFLCRYMAAQFPNDYPTSRRPRASIPVQPDDDDIVLGRIVDIAKLHFALRAALSPAEGDPSTGSADKGVDE